MARIVLRYVTRRHHVCSGRPTPKDEFAYDTVKPHQLLDDDAKTYWRKWRLASAEHALVALDGRRVVGWFRYYLYDDVDLGACGTWVHPDYRGRGIGARLWKKVLRRYRPATMRAVTLSAGGRALVRMAHQKFKVKVVRF